LMSTVKLLARMVSFLKSVWNSFQMAGSFPKIFKNRLVVSNGQVGKRLGLKLEVISAKFMFFVLDKFKLVYRTTTHLSLRTKKLLTQAVENLPSSIRQIFKKLSLFSLQIFVTTAS
jgi:hypothetical protein